MASDRRTDPAGCHRRLTRVWASRRSGENIMHSLHRPLGRAFAVLAVAAAVLSWSCPSRACGGFFCSTTPIDQTAERIIFTVNGNSTITAYVQISYTGQRDAFAWVVPVPPVPDVATFPRAAFQALDVATQP